MEVKAVNEVNEVKAVNQPKPDTLSLNYKKSSVLLTIFSALGILSVALMKNFGLRNTLDAVIYLMIIDMILICYMGLYREKVFSKSHSWWMIGISYLITIFCMYPEVQGNGVPYWILGGVILACVIDLNLGIIMTYSLTVLAAWVYGIELEQLIMHLIICTLLCILTGYLKDIIQLVYINVIIACSGMTLLLVVSDFSRKEAFSVQGIALIVFCIFAMILCYVLKRLEDRWTAISEESRAEDMSDMEAQQLISTGMMVSDISITGMTLDEVEKVIRDKDYINKLDIPVIYEKDTNILDGGITDMNMPDVDIINSYITDKGINEYSTLYLNDENTDKIDSIDLIDFDLDSLQGDFKIERKQEEERLLRQALKNTVKSDNELLIRMKAENPKLYKHGKKVADISRNAAKFIGADELTAYAGGFYHDVGKLNGKEVIEEGIKLVTEHSFPDCIADMIRQSSIKSEYPKSKEAAIIMLTDNILSAIYFFRKQGESLSVEKAVDGTFDIRLDKGILNESGMSIRDFNLLKSFYKEALKV